MYVHASCTHVDAAVHTRTYICACPCAHTCEGVRTPVCTHGHAGVCVCVCAYARVPPPRCPPRRRGLWGAVGPLPAAIWGGGSAVLPPPTAGPGSAASRRAPLIGAVAARTQGRTAGDAGWMRMRAVGCGCSRCFPRSSARCAPSSLPPFEISLSCCRTLEMSNVSASACGPMPPPGPFSHKVFFFFFPPFPLHPFALSSSPLGMGGCFPQPAGTEK